MFSSSGSLATEDFCGDFGTGSSGTKCPRLRRISFVDVSIMYDLGASAFSITVPG